MNRRADVIFGLRAYAKSSGMEDNMDEQNRQGSPYSNYQDNTANIPYQAVEPSTPNKANTLQIVGLISGIAGIVIGCCVGYIGIILGIVGLVCAIMGNKQGKTGVGTGGLVCSIIAIVFGVLSLIIVTIFGAALMAAMQEAGYYYY